MISASDRKNAVMLIDEAAASGASLAKACNVMTLSVRHNKIFINKQIRIYKY